MQRVKLSYKNQIIIAAIGLALGFVMSIVGITLVFSNPNSQHMINPKVKVDSVPGQASIQQVQDLEERLKQERQKEEAAAKAKAEEQAIATLEPQSVAPAQPTVEALPILGTDINLNNLCKSYRLNAIIFFAQPDEIGTNFAQGVPASTVKYTWEFRSTAGVSNLPTSTYTLNVPEGRSSTNVSADLSGFNKNLSARLKILSPTSYTSDWVTASDSCSGFQDSVNNNRPF